MQLFISFTVPFVVCFALTAVVRDMAVKWKIREKPNGRNNGDIAHIGGVAIATSIMIGLVPVFLFFIVRCPVSITFLSVLIVSGFTIFMLGVIDDLRSLHYRYKVLIQIIAAIFISVGGSTLLIYYSVFDLSMPIRIIVFFVVTLWVFAVTTSFNIIDGIDGLADGIVIVSSLAFAAAGFLLHQPLIVFVSVVILGSSLAFLRYNFPPAKIFMGDSGSLFLGILFGLISLMLLIPGKDIFFRIAGSIFILTIPLLDTTLAFLRRLINRQPLFEADLRHMHHLLLIRFKSMRKVNLTLWSLSLLFSILGVLTMLGYAAAFFTAVFFEIAFFVIALRAMTRMKIQIGTIDKIVKSYRAETSSSSAAAD